VTLPPRLPEDTRQAILADIEAHGGSTRAIAAKHGVSDGVVRKIAREAGITDAWSREHTENATRARQADLRAMRAQIAADLLGDVARLRDRAWSEYVVPMGVGGKDGGIELVRLELPPLGDVRNAYTSIGIALDKSLRLEQHDADVQGLAAVDAWLREMMGSD
jgi:transposase-like protein